MHHKLVPATLVMTSMRIDTKCQENRLRMRNRHALPKMGARTHLIESFCACAGMTKFPAAAAAIHTAAYL